MQRFKNILVIVNAEGLPDVVFARALWLAQMNDAKLTLLSVREPRSIDLDWLMSALPGQSAQQIDTHIDDAAQNDLQEIEAQFANHGLSVNSITAEGVGFIETIRQVLAQDHDLVLKGAEESFDWRTLGGPDLHLLRKCPCPVWVLRAGGMSDARRIMAAVDPDPEDTTRDALNHKVMQLATSLAAQDQADLDVLNAWYLYEEQLLRGRRGRVPPEVVDRILDKTRTASRWRLDQLTSAYATSGVEFNVLHIKGLPADVIVQHAQDQRVDTLVMGTLGRSGLPGFFIGNTAETVLNRVECAVLAVKPQGFVSPVRL